MNHRFFLAKKNLLILFLSTKLLIKFLIRKILKKELNSMKNKRKHETKIKLLKIRTSTNGRQQWRDICEHQPTATFANVIKRIITHNVLTTTCERAVLLPAFSWWNIPIRPTLVRVMRTKIGRYELRWRKIEIYNMLN